MVEKNGICAECGFAHWVDAPQGKNIPEGTVIVCKINGSKEMRVFDKKKKAVIDGIGR